MQIEQASTLSQEELTQKLSALHYFNEIRQLDESQFQAMIGYSRFIHLESGEYLLRSGDRDNFIYFLMRGKLNAYSSGEPEILLGTLIAGEVFGEIAAVTHGPRTAHIRVPEESRDALVFATDFSVIGDLQDHSVFHLDTKLIFYRQIVHILRWRNDLYKTKFPDSEIAGAPYKSFPAADQRGGQQELDSLFSHAKYLASRLKQLNRELGVIGNSPGPDASAPVG